MGEPKATRVRGYRQTLQELEGKRPCKKEASISCMEGKHVALFDRDPENL